MFVSYLQVNILTTPVPESEKNFKNDLPLIPVTIRTIILMEGRGWVGVVFSETH